MNKLTKVPEEFVLEKWAKGLFPGKVYLRDVDVDHARAAWVRAVLFLGDRWALIHVKSPATHHPRQIPPFITLY